MSIRRSARNKNKKVKRWDIADRRSNCGLGNTRGMGKARFFRPADRRKLGPDA